GSARLGLRADERGEAVVVLMARWAALEVRPHARDRRVRVSSGEPELDVSVEVLEALLAGQLRARRAQQSREQVGVWRDVAAAHGVAPSRTASTASPSAASRALSLRRASGTVLE